MAKRGNLRTQKGILEHCVDNNEVVFNDPEIEGAFVGQPATFHIGGDCYATQVVDVKRGADGKVRSISTGRGSTFAVKISANCQSGGGPEYPEGWRHETYLSGRTTSGWLELGVAVDYMDPHF
jgi:hypothetical protein